MYASLACLAAEPVSRTSESLFTSLLRVSARRSASLNVLLYASVGLPSAETLATAGKQALRAVAIRVRYGLIRVVGSLRRTFVRLTRLPSG